MDNSQTQRFVVPPSKSSLAPTLLVTSIEKQEAVRQFVARVGGLAHARAALELLALLPHTRREAA
jgi:hypothetical protein